MRSVHRRYYFCLMFGALVLICGSTAAVWASPNASFSGVMDQDLLTINFGDVPVGSGLHVVAFSIHNNDAMAGSTATLGLQDIDSLGDVNRLTITAAPFTGLPAGQSVAFQAQLTTSLPGMFSASYLLNLAEEAPGAMVQSLAIALFANVTPYPADFNVDGDVDGADLLTWQRGFATASNATRPTGDSDADGDVDPMDLLAWRNGFGSQATAVASVASVPEPSSWLLGLTALTMMASEAVRPTRPSNALRRLALPAAR